MNINNNKGGIMPRKLTKEEIIEKANNVHNSKYDYKLVNWDLGLLDKQKIICPIHGIFEQQMNNHINGNNGCRYCGINKQSNTRKTTKKEFIKKAIELHGDFYNYDKTIINGMHNNIIVTCPNHGEFDILAWNHINPKNYQGCKKCHCLSKEEFIIESNKIHKNKYKYDKVVWGNTKNKILITCPIHGDFLQYASHHLYNKMGCRRCGIEKKKLKIVDVLERFKYIHGDSYNYSKVKYKSFRDKVEIICPHHGSFFQSTDSHLKGNGCRKCHESKGEKYIGIFLNKNKIDYKPQKKFDTCKSSKNFRLPFDFYIPSINLLIEFDGKLHFEPWDNKPNSIKKLKRIQENDLVKTKWCENNGIKLIRINYKDDLEYHLNQILKLTKNPTT